MNASSSPMMMQLAFLFNHFWGPIKFTLKLCRRGGYRACALLAGAVYQVEVWGTPPFTFWPGLLQKLFCPNQAEHRPQDYEPRVWASSSALEKTETKDCVSDFDIEGLSKELLCGTTALHRLLPFLKCPFHKDLLPPVSLHPQPLPILSGVCF